MLSGSLIRMAVLSRLAEGPLPMAQRREPSKSAPSRNPRATGAIPMAHRRWANYTRTWPASTMTFCERAAMIHVNMVVPSGLGSGPSPRVLRGFRAAALRMRGGETIVTWV